MTSPPRQIEIRCPSCGTVYKDWYRPSINLALGEEWTDEELREGTSATCPSCGHTVDLGGLTVRPDWEFEVGLNNLGKQ